MAHAFLLPSWFFGFGIGLELLFAIITLGLAIFAYRIYKVTDQSQVKLFGISFFLISISYFLQSIFNFLIVSKANENICTALKINSIALFNYYGFYAHIIFMISGLVVLLYMTFKIKRERIFWLLLVTSLLVVYMGRDPFNVFYLLASIYLIFISWHFIENYLKNRRKKKTLLIAVAFIFLLVGRIHFNFVTNHELFYVVGHVLELFAYLFILLNFYLVKKK
ncbi:hypothetical protein ACFLZX_05850 [Nanoarchaeota archaeon]